jgi:hypothetical protein
MSFKGNGAGRGEDGHCDTPSRRKPGRVGILGTYYYSKEVIRNSDAVFSRLCDGMLFGIHAPFALQSGRYHRGELASQL